VEGKGLRSRVGKTMERTERKKEKLETNGEGGDWPWVFLKGRKTKEKGEKAYYNHLPTGRLSPSRDRDTPLVGGRKKMRYNGTTGKSPFYKREYSNKGPSYREKLL